MVQSCDTSILLINLGSPDAPEAPEVKRYLKEFLSDPRIIELSPWVWKPILHGIILNTRPAKSAAKYKTVWTDRGSPLIFHTQDLAEALSLKFASKATNVRVDFAMRYGNPSVSSVMRRLVEKEGVNRILVVPLYPQYSATTTASVMDAVCDSLKGMRYQPEVRELRDYFREPGYIQSITQSVKDHWEVVGPLPENGRLFLSYHGMPESYVLKGDPYQKQCEETTRLLIDALQIPERMVLSGYQSRFGKDVWLQPYTQPTVELLAKEGVERVDILCPGFAADCLETLEEIGEEVKESFIKAGGKTYHFIPCLNAQDYWVSAFQAILEKNLIDWIKAV